MGFPRIRRTPDELFDGSVRRTRCPGSRCAARSTFRNGDHPREDSLMPRFAVVGLVLALAVPTLAQEPDTRKVAQEILDKGAALFDTHDAAAMAATYIEDARLFI